MKYELMAILDPSKTEKEQEKLLDEIRKIFIDHGLAFVEEDIWGLRQMAYKIKSFTTGYYAVINFEGEGTDLPKINRELRLLPGLVRYVILKMPDEYSLMRYEETAQTKADRKLKLNKQAEEIQEKVKKSAKKDVEVVEAPVEEPVVEEVEVQEEETIAEVEEVVEEKEQEEKPEKKSANLDEKLQAIIDDTDIDI